MGFFTLKKMAPCLESSSGHGILWLVSEIVVLAFGSIPLALPLYYIISWPPIGANVKSSYADSDDRPMAVCEFGGFVAVESEN